MYFLSKLKPMKEENNDKYKAKRKSSNTCACLNYNSQALGRMADTKMLNNSIITIIKCRIILTPIIRGRSQCTPSDPYPAHRSLHPVKPDTKKHLAEHDYPRRHKKHKLAGVKHCIK